MRSSACEVRSRCAPALGACVFWFQGQLTQPTMCNSPLFTRSSPFPLLGVTLEPTSGRGRRRVGVVPGFQTFASRRGVAEVVVPELPQEPLRDILPKPQRLRAAERPMDSSNSCQNNAALHQLHDHMRCGLVSKHSFAAWHGSLQMRVCKYI